VADKNFKVKSGLNIPITSAAILTTDSSGNISSTNVLPITAGGTGQTSATNAINALLPVQNGSTVNYVIQSDGTNINWGKLYNQTIKNNGTTVTPRGNINVIGATFADDSGTDTTTITFTDTTGVSTSGGSTITTSSASVKGLIIKGAASQTAKLQEWQNSSSLVVASMDDSGKLVVPTIRGPAGSVVTLGTDGQPYSLSISNTQFDSYGPVPWRPYNSSMVGFIVKGQASQTANLQEWQNSAGTVLTSISALGALTVNSNATSYFGTGPSIFGTTLAVSTRSSGTIGQIIKGVTSQTANLQEWQNSAGTVLAKVDASGAMFTTTAAAGTNTTQVATTEFVKTAIDNLVDSAPGTLDTLNEIAAALNDDPNFYTTITTLTSALENNDVYNYMGVF
jgi:hypothetical protein